jgi:hypothetical protein
MKVPEIALDKNYVLEEHIPMIEKAKEKVDKLEAGICRPRR